MTDTNATERADMLANAIAAKLLGAVNAPEQEIYRISREIVALASQAAQPAEADGWVMVPRQLTEEMARAGANGRQNSARASFEDGWKLALAATPKAPATDVGGWIVANGPGNRWRTWKDGFSAWTDDREQATRYARRQDAEAVHAEDDDAWAIIPYGEAK